MAMIIAYRIPAPLLSGSISNRRIPAKQETDEAASTTPTAPKTAFAAAFLPADCADTNHPLHAKRKIPKIQMMMITPFSFSW